MRRAVFAVFAVLALSTAPAVQASPPAPCDCVSCLLEPDRLCTEWFTIEIKPCREFSAEHCPAASASRPQSSASRPQSSASRPQSSAGDFACALSGELPQTGTRATEAVDPVPPTDR